MITEYGRGLYSFDAQYIRPGLLSIHVIRDGGRIALVDTGNYEALPHMLSALAELGASPSDVDWLLLTHVHLDHAGAAGLFAKELPAARVVVHPRGGRHVIDPTRLRHAVADVYGKEEADRLYGELLPVAPERVVTPTDGMELPLGARRITCLHTPGHAKHHLAFHDGTANVVFSGDAFGIFQKGTGATPIPSTSPSQFDPEEMHASIERIMALEPKAIHPAHYGRMTETAHAASELHRLIDLQLAAVESARGDLAETQEALLQLFDRERQQQGWQMTKEELELIFSVELPINAQGLCGWYRRTEQAGR